YHFQIAELSFRPQFPPPSDYFYERQRAHLMSAVFGMLMLTGTMAAAEPNVTLYQLQKNCERLVAETFNRETADDGDRGTTIVRIIRGAGGLPWIVPHLHAGPPFIPTCC